MSKQGREYPDSALISIDSNTADKILHDHTKLTNSGICTYLNEAGKRPLVGDQIDYNGKRYKVILIDYVDGRTLLTFGGGNSVYMGIHISETVFISRKPFAR